MRGQVNIGDRYRDCTAVWTQWQVARIYQDLLGVPHAVVTSVSDTMERRTIACPTLLDRRRFKLTAEDGAATDLPVMAEGNAGRRACGGGASVPHH